MLTAVQRNGARFIHEAGKGIRAIRVAVAPGVTITTSNPATYERVTGEKLKEKVKKVFKGGGKPKGGTSRPSFA